MTSTTKLSLFEVPLHFGRRLDARKESCFQAGIWGLILSIALGGCSSPSVSASSTTTQQDSCSTIVHNEAPSKDSWRVRPLASVALPPERWAPKQIVSFSGQRQPDGSMLIASTDQNLLARLHIDKTLVVDNIVPPEETFSRSAVWGGRGLANNLITYDRTHHITELRFTTETGRSVEIAALPINDSAVVMGVAGILPDSSFVVQAAPRIRPSRGLHRLTQLLYIYDSDGRPRRLFRKLPGNQALITQLGNTPGDAIMRPLFSRRALVAVARDGSIITVDNDRFEFSILRADGCKIVTSTLNKSNKPVRARDVRLAIKEKRQYQKNFPQIAVDVLTEAAPSTMPAFDDLALGQDGTIWLREFPRPFDPRASWWVFGADGGLIGSVTLQSGDRLISIDGADLVIARTEKGGATFMFLTLIDV